MQKMIVNYIQRLFRTDYSLEAFYRLACDDPVLVKLVGMFYGLKNLRTINTFETLIWAFIGQLREMKFTRNKVECIIGLPKEITENGKMLDCANAMNDVEARAHLLAIGGVCPWTCEYCILCSLGREDACPSGDAG